MSSCDTGAAMSKALVRACNSARMLLPHANDATRLSSTLADGFTKPSTARTSTGASVATRTSCSLPPCMSGSGKSSSVVILKCVARLPRRRLPPLASGYSSDDELHRTTDVRPLDAPARVLISVITSRKWGSERLNSSSASSIMIMRNRASASRCAVRSSNVSRGGFSAAVPMSEVALAG